MTPLKSALAAVAMLAIGLVALAAGPAASGASQTGSCDGTLIVSKPLKFKQHKVGELDVYWNVATQRNCAVTMHAGSTWGKRLRTTISLYRCAKGVKAGEDCNSDINHMHKQDGMFRYHAGPVRIGAAHRCIFAIGDIQMERFHWAVQSTRLAFKAAYCN